MIHITLAQNVNINSVIPLNQCTRNDRLLYITFHLLARKSKKVALSNIFFVRNFYHSPFFP